MTSSSEVVPCATFSAPAIPQNVWFVGTANHDETTKDFADKTYDRAHVMKLPATGSCSSRSGCQHGRPSRSTLSGAPSTRRERPTRKRRRPRIGSSTSRSLTCWAGASGSGGAIVLSGRCSISSVIVAAGGTVGEAVDAHPRHQAPSQGPEESARHTARGSGRTAGPDCRGMASAGRQGSGHPVRGDHSR